MDEEVLPHMAPQKREAILLIGRRKCGEVNFVLDNTVIHTSRVYFDQPMKGSEHIKRSCNKATKAATQLARLMPSRIGPKDSRRRLLTSVAKSIVLFKAPTLETEHNVKALRKAQRVLALKVVRGYRTISTSGILVLAELIPRNTELINGNDI